MRGRRVPLTGSLKGSTSVLLKGSARAHRVSTRVEGLGRYPKDLYT